MLHILDLNLVEKFTAEYSMYISVVMRRLIGSFNASLFLLEQYSLSRFEIRLYIKLWRITAKVHRIRITL